MWLDIIVGSIFVFSTAKGYRKGFIRTIIHAVGWFLAMVLGYIFYPRIAAFLHGKTNLYDFVHTKVLEKIGNEGSPVMDPISGNLPAVFKNALDSAEQTVVSVLADGLSGLLFNVITFLGLIIGIRILFLFLSILFGKRRKKGISGFVDGFLGLIAGMLKGAILIFLFLAFLVPVISLSDSDIIINSLGNSRFAGMLYDNNLIFLIVHDFL